MKELNEVEFKKLKKEELLKMFQDTKNVSVTFGSNRIDLNYCSGTKHGIKNCDLVEVSHLSKVAKPYHSVDEDDDDVWHTEFSKPISPIDMEKAVATFQRLYKNVKAGKKTIIKDLTSEEIESIVRFCNRPINIKDEGYQAFVKGLNLVTGNPYPSNLDCHWEWRKGYLEGFSEANPPCW
jgi:hypothetical protein